MRDCVSLVLLFPLLLPGERTASAAEPEQSFELLVVGPDQKPVPQAAVELRTSPAPTAEQIRTGTFIKKGTYGTFVTADAQGRLVVQLPAMPKRWDVNIQTPGYGPYWASWSPAENTESIPTRFTAELEAGWSVGGIVVDSAGDPVVDVKVRPSIEYKKRPGYLKQLGVGMNLKTDAEGKWRFDSVPDSKSDVHVEFSHPGFMSLRGPLARTQFEIMRDGAPAAQTVLDRGLTLTGTVTDQAGNPIAGALVRTKFLNDIREAKTNAEGVYLLGGCESSAVRIVVSAKGQATDMKEVRIAREMEPLNFQMQPGGTVRIRVIDEHDKPLPKARIFFQRWRGPFQYFEFNHVSQYADEQGVWEWREAPLDEFQADICRPDGMQLGKQPLIARAEEFVFRPPPALVITGKVVSAETGQAIPKFTVVPGVRFEQPQWSRGEQFLATEGKYRFRKVHDAVAHLVRIEAEGYRAAVSRDIQSNEGSIEIDFQLERGLDLAAKVLTPEGQPAAKARVALGIAGSQINVANGRIREDSTYCARQDTDESGQFRIPPQDAPFQLVIMHPSGYAHVHGTPEEIPAAIKLQPWARIEGTFRVGKDPAAGVPLTINSNGLNSYGKDVPRIYTEHEVTTGKDGRFVFERVIPGSGRIGRRLLLMVDQGAVEMVSSCMTPAMFPGGETTRIDLGGIGGAVVGQLQPPRARAPVKWHFALVYLSAHLPDPPMPPAPPIPPDVAANIARREAWLLEWRQTPAGQAWTAWQFAVEANQNRRDAQPRFTAAVKPDGTFRIDDVAEGRYALSVQFSQEGAGRLQGYFVSVPAFAGGRSDEPLDLGVLTLE